jgi:hypothetical protein
VNKNTTDDFLKQLDDEFGKENPTNIQYGPINYLGINFDYTKKGSAKTDMHGFSDDIL